LEILDQRTIPAKYRFLVYSYNNSAVLNFSNEPIYKLNKQVPILLNEDKIITRRQKGVGANTQLRVLTESVLTFDKRR
jgi:hypothetical protein